MFWLPPTDMAITRSRTSTMKEHIKLDEKDEYAISLLEEFNTTFAPIPINDTYLFGEINTINLTDSSKLNHALDPFYAQFGTLGIHYDVHDRRPYIICEKLNRSECDPDLRTDCPVAQRCFLDTSKRSQRLGCMSVYSYNASKYANYHNWTEPKVVPKVEVTLKGCWQHDREVLQECIAEDKCMQDGKLEDGPTFCCCMRHMCNHHVMVTHERLPIYTPVAPSAGDSIFRAEVTSSEGLFDSALFSICVIVLMVVLCVLISVLIAYTWKMFCRDGFIKTQTTATVIDTDQERLIKHNVSAPVPDPFIAVSNLERVSRGRFGDVYKGIITQGETRDVAVKVFTQDAASSWMAEQEIYVQPSLNAHRSILHFIGAEVRGDQYWLVTEYLSNGSLHDYIKSHCVSLEQSMRIMTTLLDGMSYLHEERMVDGKIKPTVVHRDVKSRNILLHDDLSACIADFGLAMSCEGGVAKMGLDNGGEPTTTITQVGTYRYMSPEVLEGATEFSVAAFRQADVYATALVMWEIMSRTEAVPGEEIGEYKLPYEVETAGVRAPSLAEMRECVVVRKRRPKNRETLRNNPILSRVCDTTEEMWDQEADGRITAACALERLRSLYRDSATVSEEESVDNGSTISSAGPSCLHPRIPEGSMSSAGFHHEMANYENDRIERERIALDAELLEMS